MSDDDANFTVRLINEVMAPARAIKAQFKEIRDAIGGIDNPLKDMTKNMAVAGGAASHAGGMMRQAFSYAIGQVMVRAAHEVLDLGASLARSTVQAADFSQRMSMGFTALLKDGPAAKALFADTRKLAERLGLDVFDTSRQMLRFTSLGFSPEMGTDLIKMGADLRGFGATGEEVNRIMTQLGQIQSKGKLQGEELVVLAENGISTQRVYENLMKTLGKTKAEILKMQQAGKLTSDMAFPAIMDAVKGMTGEANLGDTGAKVAESSIGGIFDVLKAKWQNLLTDIGEQTTGPMMDAIRPIAEELGNFLSSSELKEGIVSAITEIATVAREAIPFVKEFVGGFADGFREAWPEIKGALNILFEGFGGRTPWLITMGNFATTLGEVAAAAAGVAAVMGGMLAAGVQMVTSVTRLATEAWGGMIEGIGGALFAVNDFTENVSARWERLKTDAVEAAYDMIQGLVQGISDGLESVLDVVKNLGTGAIDMLRAVFRSHSPSEAFAEIGDDAAAGLGGGMDRSAPVVESASARMGRTALGGAANENGSARGGAFGGDLNITVQVGGREPGENVDDFGNRIASAVERKVKMMFEEVAA